MPEVIQPAPGNLLIEEIKPGERTTEAGIILTGEGEERKNWSRKGLVIRSGSRVYRPGNVVFFGHYNSEQVSKTQYLLNEQHVQAYLMKED